ncbi:MAG: putative hydrolase or acyltransferase of alpha/beta superfamily [Frankiales bacterium]|nr:putative hydrolase or acyltransferase of alpha/beta superfamily [Frankiales bacterium]
MDALRTPDDRFADLPDYPFTPAYADVGDGLRMHYAAAGPADGPVVLLMHGQPTWSYLYRHVIRELADKGVRAIAPDLIGYGRSDKPTSRFDYSLKAHIGWVADFVEALNLRDITLVCQDWGGPVGLGVLARNPDRFARVVAANTILHNADPELEGRLTWTVHGIEGERVVIQEALLDYVLMSLRSPEFRASVLVDFATQRSLSTAELAAYDAPFPSEEHMAGLRQMSALIPLTRNDPGARINNKTVAVVREWTKPFLTAYSTGDPATQGWAEVFQSVVPGAAGQEHVQLAGGHFLQEDSGVELARAIRGFMVRCVTEARTGRATGQRTVSSWSRALR